MNPMRYLQQYVCTWLGALALASHAAGQESFRETPFVRQSHEVWEHSNKHLLTLTVGNRPVSDLLGPVLRHNYSLPKAQVCDSGSHSPHHWHSCIDLLPCHAWFSCKARGWPRACALARASTDAVLLKASSGTARAARLPLSLCVRACRCGAASPTMARHTACGAWCTA